MIRSKLNKSPWLGIRKRTAACTFFFLVMLGGTATAQEKWNGVIRTGINFPLQKMAGIDLKTGAGIDVLLGYRLRKNLLLNVGWGWNHFNADNETAGPKYGYEETGYTLGAHWVQPIRSSRFSCVVGAHAIYNQIEVGAGEGNIVYDTGHGWGWQAGGGLGIKIADNFLIIPGIRYRSLNRKMKTDGITTPAELRYLSAGIGFSFDF